MTIEPMFGIQSDWHRHLTVQDPTGAVTTDLLGDTGWWRGSNLYQHATGTYILHEGQAGCVGFDLAPPRFDPHAGRLCKKRPQPLPAADPPANVPTAPVQSRFYTDLSYVGRFTETYGDGARIIFENPSEQPETELPDIL